MEDSVDDRGKAFPRDGYTCFVVWVTGHGKGSVPGGDSRIEVLGDALVGILCGLALNELNRRFEGVSRTVEEYRREIAR